jgi:trk system potassium uptake protein TrkA
MKIVIVGAGAVGSLVAQRLAGDFHDVTLIEANEDIANHAQATLDVLVLRGNGATADKLREAGADKADIVIAVTDRDEINMLACIQAGNLGVATRVARVRNPEYCDDHMTSLMGIDQVINPDRVAVEEIHELLMRPAATELYEFADGRVQVIGARVGAGASVLGRTLREVEAEVGSRWSLVAAVTRAGETIIPRGDDSLQEDDHVFLVGRRGKVTRALEHLARPRQRVQSVMVAGAGPIGVSLVARLVEDGLHVRLIESDPETARHASERLENTLVLCGDATDGELLRSEGLDTMDAFVAVTNDEQVNLTSCLLAKRRHVAKAIALIKRPNFVPLALDIGIDAAVSPRLSMARAIMRFFRRGNVLSHTSLPDSEAEIMELEATANSPIVGKPLATLDLPREAIVAALIKPYQVVVPRGSDVIEDGDKVLVFALPAAMKSFQKLF